MLHVFSGLHQFGGGFVQEHRQGQALQVLWQPGGSKDRVCEVACCHVRMRMARLSNRIFQQRPEVQGGLFFLWLWERLAPCACHLCHVCLVYFT